MTRFPVDSPPGPGVCLSPFEVYRCPGRVTAIVGGFGSGKSEVSVNLALTSAGQGATVEIADLDVVNPYFRCREVRDEMEKNGIRVVVPGAEYHDADLPIILPELKGMIRAGAATVILDVGGDELGARLLGSFADSFQDTPHSVLFVVNGFRPITPDLSGTMKILREVEEASRLKVSGLISNAHLMEQTTVETVLTGCELAEAVATESGLPLEFVSVMESLLESPELKNLKHAVLPIRRRLLRPWEMQPNKGSMRSSNA